MPSSSLSLDRSKNYLLEKLNTLLRPDPYIIKIEFFFFILLLKTSDLWEHLHVTHWAHPMLHEGQPASTLRTLSGSPALGVPNFFTGYDVGHMTRHKNYVLSLCTHHGCSLRQTSNNACWMKNQNGKGVYLLLPKALSLSSTTVISLCYNHWTPGESQKLYRKYFLVLSFPQIRSK